MSLLRSLLPFLVAVALVSFKKDDHIPTCSIDFKGFETLTAQAPDRLPKQAREPRVIPIAGGTVTISRTDGYRILYNNDKGAAFVNMKVESCEPSFYKDDQLKLLQNLNYLNDEASTGTETSGKLIEIESNGYKIWGFSRNSIAQGQNLGTFAMFPGDNVIVYFYFNNLNAEYRNFESWESYVQQRNDFIQAYIQTI